MYPCHTAFNFHDIFNVNQMQMSLKNGTNKKDHF